MEEVSGPVIAVALVLSAVFVPCAFITGITGQFFRQFALTIAVSTVISALNSLTLSPALAALLLKPKGARRRPDRPRADLPPGLVLPALQLRLPARDQRLHAGRRDAAARQRPGAGVYGGHAGLTYWGFNQLPTGYIPTQDKGYLLVSLQLPDAASLERTQEVVDRSTESPRGAGASATRSRSPASRSCSAPTAPTSASSSSPSKPFDERRDAGHVQRRRSPTG